MRMDQTFPVNVEPIPGYRLIERLGRGGYGEVWKAEAPGGMHKAVKFVYGNIESAGDDAKGAEQEFRSLNRVKTIRHPFLLSLERFDVIEGQLVIVMELADRNLADRFNECVASGLPGIPRQELLRYMEEAAEALDLMNQHHQIQHLDIKPQNIFLVQRHVKVADFGLAKDMEGARADLTGGLTPTYAPPESFDQWVSRQSDQYSLAIVYMEMLTGRRPFNGTNTRQLIIQHLTAAPDLSPLKQPDSGAVGKALSKKPDDRFRTCLDFVQALKGEVSASPPEVVAPIAPKAPPVAKSTSSPDCMTERNISPRVKTLPALVTPRSKVWSPSSQNNIRIPVTPPAEARRNEKPKEQTGNGTLVPALVIGIGGTGLAVLRSIRQQILNSFGRPTLPHLRWLYIDTDPASADLALDPSSPVALSAEDVVLLRLKRSSHYLSHEALPPVDSWLPPEALYRISRTLTTDGMRSLGRLALCDHYHIVCHRLRTSLEPFLKSNGIEEADRMTRLGVRSTFPRLYLVTSLTGGTGSGMFLDLAYLAKREMRSLGFRSRTIGFLGIPEDSKDSVDVQARANAGAALNELSHFGESDQPYEAFFDKREGRVQDTERAFNRCTMFRVPWRPDPQQTNATAALPSYLVLGELLSPMDRRVHPDDTIAPTNSMETAGMYRVVWPRSAILRRTAWRLVRRTLSTWIDSTADGVGVAARRIVGEKWDDLGLTRAGLQKSLESHLKKALGGALSERIEHALGPLTDTTGPDLDVMPRIRAAFRQLVEIFGKPGSSEREPRSAVGNALTFRVGELTTQADAKLTTLALTMVEQPELRLFGAEESLAELKIRLTEEHKQVMQEAVTFEEGDRALFEPINVQVTPASRDAGFRIASWTYSSAEAVAILRRWAIVRIDAQISRATASIYSTLLSNIPDHVREIGSIRTQLDAFLKQLDEAPPTEVASDGICRILFHEDINTTNDAASRLLAKLPAEDLRQFEHQLQGRLRHECRGIMNICSRPKDQGAQFLALLQETAMQFLDSRMPAHSIGRILSTALATSSKPEVRAREFLAAANPAGFGNLSKIETYLAVPDDGSDLKRRLHELCRGENIRDAGSTDDVVIWRVCRGISAQSLSYLTSGATFGTEGDISQPRSAYSRIDVPWGLDVVT